MISRFSVKRPYTVVVGIVLILILGYVSFTSMQTDLLPDMTLPYTIVYTTYPGASPEEVETIVTRPVEQSMATISNIENISSVSSENISMVILEFSQSTNMDAVTIEIREKLDQIEGYWDDSVGSPIIMKLNPDMMPVMVAAMEADDMDQSDLTDLVNNKIVPELESVEGVASVSTSGTIKEQVQVTLREDKIEEANKKIQDALNKKFDDAREELEEAQSELDAGREELESGQNELVGQTSQADNKLNAGNYQMITGENQIDQNLAKVESGLSQLETARKDLEEKEKEIQNGKTQLEALPQQKEQADAGLKQLNDGIAQLENAPQNLAYIEAVLAAWTAQYEQTLAALDPGQITDPGISGGDIYIENAEGDDISLDPEEPVQENPAIDGYPEAGGENPETDGLSGMSEETALPGSGQEPEISARGETAAAMPAETEVLQTAQEGADPVDEAVEKALQSMNKSYAETVAEDPELLKVIEQIKMITDLSTLSAQVTEWTKKKAEAQTSLAYLGVDVTKSGEALKASIDTAKGNLISQKSSLQEKVTQLDEAIASSSEQLATLEAGLREIASGKTELDGKKAELEAAKAQLEGAKKQIASGQSSLSAAVEELNKAKITATIEMAAGKAELSSGQKQIDAALEEIEKQKDTAMEQADVTKIITADMVKGILAAQNFSMPAGYVTEDGIDFLVRVGNKLEQTEDIGNLLILDMHMDDLEPIRLSDVADVTVLNDSDKVYAKINGNSGVVFSMQKQSGYSTGDVSDRIKKRFAELEEENEGVRFVRLMDQGIYIDMVVDSVIQNMLSGAGLAVIVLLLFLKSIGSTFVIACSIPISIMAAIVLMYFSGITLNIISLSGLALGIGMLVDNSIVVIENIYRMRNEGIPAKKAAVEGAKQVSGAIAASTLTTICVFAPIVFTEGITRQLFVDMGLTIAYSLLASLVTALTLVPMMSAGLLKNSREKKAPIFRMIQNGYAKLLGAALKGKILVLLLAVGLLVYSAKLSISKGTAFMPEMESTQVMVTLNMPEGNTLDETGKTADQVMEQILKIPDVTDVGAMAAGNSMASLMGGSQEASADQVTMYVLLSEDKTITNNELAEEILQKTAGLDCETVVDTSTMDMSALGGSGISINIKGRDLDQLKKMAGEVADILSAVEGTENVSDGIEEKTLEMRLVVNKDNAMNYQLTTAQVYQFLQQKLADASTATTLSTVSKDYPVLVVSDTDETLTRDKIKKLSMTGKDEEGKDVEVPLSELVEFQSTEGFSSINRSAQTRYVTVTAGIDSNHNIGLVSADVERALKDYEIPKGYSLEMAGEDDTINEAMGEVLKMLALAIAFMYLIMVAQFQSLLSPFIVMFTIPLAFTGGFIGLYLTDSPVSVIAMIGFVMLSGIIVNNGIVLVDYTNQLRRGGMEKRTALVESGRTRLRPVIMTALTTILGLFPMAVGMGMGADMVRPMAVVTVGGLVYGTLLTLFVVPCIYDLLNRKKDMTEEEV